MVTEIEEKQRSHPSPVNYVKFIPWNTSIFLFFVDPNFYEISEVLFFFYFWKDLEFVHFQWSPIHRKRYWLIHIQKDKLHLPKTREIWVWHKPKPPFLLILLLNYYAWLTCHGICLTYTHKRPHLITKIGTSIVWAVIMSSNIYSKCQLLFFFFFFDIVWVQYFNVMWLMYKLNPINTKICIQNLSRDHMVECTWILYLNQNLSRDYMVLSWVLINILPKSDFFFLFNEYTKNIKILHQLPYRSNNSRDWRWRPLVGTWVKVYLYCILPTRLETWQISHVNIANCDQNNINLYDTTFNIIFIIHKSQSITSQ